MAKAELTDTQVQGHTPDALDRLIAMAADIAQRNGLLDEPILDQDESAEGVEGVSETERTSERRSA